MADDTNYLLSVEKALLLVMVLVKLTILVNKVHFRGVRGAAYRGIFAQICPWEW